jgi:ribonuclease T2
VRKLNVPDLTPDPNGTMTAGQVREAFLKGNRGMTRDGLNVRVNKDGRLTEVWVCMDLKFKLAACRGGNGTPDHVTIRVTPKR